MYTPPNQKSGTTSSKYKTYRLMKERRIGHQVCVLVSEARKVASMVLTVLLNAYEYHIRCLLDAPNAHRNFRDMDVAFTDKIALALNRVDLYTTVELHISIELLSFLQCQKLMAMQIVDRATKSQQGERGHVAFEQARRKICSVCSPSTSGELSSPFPVAWSSISL